MMSGEISLGKGWYVNYLEYETFHFDILNLSSNGIESCFHNVGPRVPFIP